MKKNTLQTNQMESNRSAGENTLLSFSNDSGRVLPRGKAINGRAWKKSLCVLLLFIIPLDQKCLKHYSQIARLNIEKHAHTHQINVILD